MPHVRSDGAKDVAATRPRKATALRLRRRAHGAAAAAAADAHPRKGRHEQRLLVGTGAIVRISGRPTPRFGHSAVPSHLLSGAVPTLFRSTGTDVKACPVAPQLRSDTYSSHGCSSLQGRITARAEILVAPGKQLRSISFLSRILIQQVGHDVLSSQLLPRDLLTTTSPGRR